MLALTQIPRIKVDTDPENMLSEQSSARVFHRAMKKEFALYDMIVLGITYQYPMNPDGVFNVETLNRVYQITEEIKEVPGVVAREVIALSTKDNIEQDGIGAVRFDWLMPEPIKTREQALLIRQQAQSHPMFRDSVISENGQALALYIPIERKDLSYQIAQKIRMIYQKYSRPAERYYITGLPVANDQFGVEMFKQMAISAPLAGLVIFLLMWWFFKSLALIVAPMLLAIATVVITMGLLIAFGFPVHIMSSMIPIFLMPIAVLDSVHILSEFFDKYPKFRDKKKAIVFVMKELFSPMLFTSLTSIAGFFSLSFSPIPPVQVFGIFVALGVAIAWLLTMVFIPAYIMLLNEKSFSRFQIQDHSEDGAFLNRILLRLKGMVLTHAKIVLIASVVIAAVSVYGISRIQVNDNPVRWFGKNHPIRVADRVLNKHFSGTYEAYFVLEAEDHDSEIFLEPEMLRYVEGLQQEMVKSNLVGKATSLTDIVKKVYYELLGGDPVNNVVPDTKAAVAQCLISFENSHKPDDLWHMTTPDYSKLNIWMQLKSGDNKDMSRVIGLVREYMENNPPPFAIQTNWAGLTYINVVWQHNMVFGMMNNFLGSFIIVLFMMLFLFRSPVKAAVSMIPLTLTIVFIYSLLGFFGKDYDMPVAVLSALTLGLSVDFAIHFIQRAIEVHETAGSWQKTADEMFQGPGRAIVRNALVVAIGFLPLLAAPLVPYKTVGFFMFAIMAVSSLATLIILPAIVTVIPDKIFASDRCPFFCRCGGCVLIGIFVAAAVAYMMIGYTAVGWKISTFVSIGIVAVFSLFCHQASKHSICASKEE
jgi:hydrophobe/amphiphile efflux-3 (HAE3) family protein